ncbi:MAG: C1 family peptidase [Prevotella sp.]|uniref:C1 family peptidase n=1 Tax=Prevotella sp. TaxID=59823 RepID=UPI002A32D018|nr:C1 family peptidase [Prevotella sp.]MDD7317666.1 C1 family peptidase [Prevotellaceae bacterium]MDY4020487.1 C1 family peptidase [Prevotella sp.]
MKKILTLALAAMLATGAMAQETEENKNKPVFTTIKEMPITSIKDQNRSGTCWAYSTLSFFESEILKATGKNVDLCEMFVANKDYMERAILTVRMHGDSQFSQGGSAGDVLDIIKRHGICPETAMPLPGTMQGDSLANFNEFFDVMSPFVDAVAKNKAKKISNQWRVGLQGILDAYLGECPEKFVYEGKTYTPKQFAESLGLNWNDYVSITSYTHHPFYTSFPVEVQDNWRWDRSYNVPMDEMMRIIDNALDNGYTIAWGGDVSEEGFTRKGLAIAYDTKAVQSLSGSDAARWLKLSAKEKNNKFEELGINAPEIVPTQQLRQEGFDTWELTDDHGMHIYGLAKDQNGKEYYMVKNSWGEYGDYKGTWYMTKAFVAAKTMDYLVNKNAIPKDIRKKLGI